MDRIKKKRTTQRAVFTRALNTFNETLGAALDLKSIKIAFQVLEEKIKDLDETSNQVLDLLFDSPDTTDDAIEQEYQDTDVYKRKFLAAKLAMEEFSSASATEAPTVSTQNGTGEIKKTFRLPKIELCKFGGNVREWLQFWSLFKKIHEDTGIAREDKFQYLIQAMVPNSRAEELVKSFPPTGDNYDKVITSLKNRFGREDIQIEVYVRELLQLVLQNAMSPGKNVVLSSLYDKIESHLRALESLGVTTDKCAAMLFPLVESSLPEELLRVWQRSSFNSSSSHDTMGADKSKNKLTQLIKFLEEEVENELRISMAVEGFNFQEKNNTDGYKQKRDKPRSHKDVPSATGLLATKNKSKSCLFCSAKDHESANCEQAKKMSLAERQGVVKQKFACFNCLNIGHNFKKCRVNLKCAWCSRRHVLLMCPNMAKEQNENKCTEKVVEEKNLANVNSDPEVYLKTLRVILYNKDKKSVIRLVIDEGSQRSYITKAAAAQVSYEPVAEQLMNHSLFGGEKSGTVSHKKYVIRLSSLEEDFKCNFTALDQNVICEEIPIVKSGPWLNELDALNIRISDMDKGDEAVSVLVGADVAGKLMTGRRHILKCGLVAVETYLGWTMMGAIAPTEQREDAAITTYAMFVHSRKVEDLWSLDVLGIKDPIEVKSRRDRHREIKEDFLKTVCRNEEGRYEVKLPWLENHPALNDNKNMAIRRLQTTVKKLRSDGVFEEYAAVFRDWLAEGIIEYVPDDQKDNWGHYLPHRHVIKENSTTRIRPVFDASAKTYPFPSLNECLEKGENLIEQIPSMFFRFRMDNIGVISDIKRAFLQISLDCSDRDFLRFLWVNEKDDIVVLRHCRVVFGVSSSPFILGVVINMHLNNIIKSLENGLNEKFSINNIRKLAESFYVDNCVTSVNSFEQLHGFISDAKAVMQLASFDLRGWEHSGDGSPGDRTAVLGLSWDKSRDVLCLSVPDFEKCLDGKITKRNILSTAHRIFDPLGFASPVVLCPRLLLQETWAQNLSWDDEVTNDVKAKFFNWVRSLQNLDKIEIPRCMLGDISCKDNVSIHTFCDASKTAYAAVVFVRIESGSNVKLSFVQAKTRVAPVRKKLIDARQSIPRLELLAATIAVRLTSAILDILRLERTNVFYWSDSSTVVAWIRRNSNWTTFVYNRVQEIREFSDPDQWRHIPGHLNPADLPSRGCTVDQLLISRWWEGPEWLRMRSENWPVNEAQCNEVEVNSELKKSALKNSNTAVLLSTTENDSRENKPWYVERYSQYTKVIRVIAWIKRFQFNCRNRPGFRVKGDLLFKEIQESRILLLKLIQAECFTDENDARVSHLNAFKDKDGLIRLKSKIVLREDIYCFKCPIVLPSRHKIVDLIIKEKHEKLSHAGVEVTLNSLREEYWILGGRRTIRSIIKRCVNCRRHETESFESACAPLPLDRVKDAAVFEVVGVDYTGPIYLKGGKKSWVCLFTCAVFRAVHFELVTSLSTASFLMTLRRFIARRGRPSVIYSDNGTNFVGLSNMFKQLDFEKLTRTLAIEQIQWKFNPPSAAWWGGFWERLNGILKRLLRRTLKRSCLDYEEMLTVLLDCEAVINSRPITFLSESKQDVLPITPSMFLQEVKEIGVLDLDKIERCDLSKRYLYRQKIKEDLRKRFRIEYLGALIHRKSNTKNVKTIEIGDIVLIENENAKRLDWPLARVKELIRGKDGNVRVVRLKTAGGELMRPIQRLYPLELSYGKDVSMIKEVMRENCVRVNLCDESQCDAQNVNKTTSDKTSVDDTHYITRSGRRVKPPQRL